MKFASIAALFVFFIPQWASAAPILVQQLAACSLRDNDEARLVCFDRVAEANREIQTERDRQKSAIMNDDAYAKSMRSLSNIGKTAPAQ